MKISLITSNYYDGLTRVQKQDICNGTGAKGSPEWLIKLLDSFDGIGINYRRASNRHDCGYYFAVTAGCKIKADFVFLINMIILSINAFLVLPLATSVGNIIFFPVRIIRALIYFLAVFLFGWFAWTPDLKHKEI